MSRLSRRSRLLACLAAAVAAALTALPESAHAQGRVVAACARPMPEESRINRPCEPSVVRVATSTMVEITGRVARTTITETFENRGRALGEADFVFPLPSGAAFEELRLEIDGKLVPGEVLGAREARETYERIVRELRDPALVEWAGLGLLRTRIFPFRAGERRTVVVKLAHVVPLDGDALRVTGRLMSGSDISDETATGSFRIRWRGDSLGTPWSPTHDVGRVRSNDGARREVTLSGRAGDVVAYLPIRRTSREPTVTMLTHGGSGNERHALVIVSPPQEAPRAMARDITLVLDVSGSMRGVKMTQAVAAGHALLGTLRSDDRFRLIAFSDQVDAHSSQLVSVSAASLRAARTWLDELQASGGTNIGEALRTALRAGRSTPPDEGVHASSNARLPLTLLITDGQPTNGLRSADILDSTATWRGATRVFTFGVGSDVDASLVEQLALGGRGAAHFVRPEESVERAVSLLAERLAAPLLANVEVRVEGGTLRELYAPYGVDLMAGQELVFLARYTGRTNGRVHITGTSGTARRTAQSSYTFSSRDSANAFVPRLWAVQRVAALDADRRRHGASAEIDDELRKLGERYGIPTPLTSYFVREPMMVAGGTARGTLASVAVPGRGVSVQGGVASAPAQVAAPEASVAFEQARRASEQRKVMNLSSADAMLQASASDGAPRARSEGGATRVVNGRLFTLVDSTWTDQRLIDEPAWRGAVMVRVRPFSSAWTELARAVPSIREALALGDRVRVRGTNAIVEVAPDGVSTLDSGAIRRLVAQW